MDAEMIASDEDQIKQESTVIYTQDEFGRSTLRETVAWKC